MVSGEPGVDWGGARRRDAGRNAAPQSVPCAPRRVIMILRVATLTSHPNTCDSLNSFE